MTLDTPLDARQQALARSRLYALLARLFVRGVDERSLAQLEPLGWAPPALAEAGPGAERARVLDELAAEHHASFALGVFPYAGVFLDPSARAGACDDRVRSFYARAGFAPRLDELSADHLGVELSFLSFVCGAQAEALEDGRPRLAAALEPVLAEFLDACVLGFLPALVVALDGLGRAEFRFWPTLAHEALTLVAEHRARLPGPIMPSLFGALSRPDSSPARVAELLDDERTGLRRIAEHLLTPAATGVFLSRADIAALGRRRELPRGFGSRLLMLDNLLRSAVEYGELGRLLGDLDDRLGQRDHALARLAGACELELAVAPWRDALATTRALLDRLAHSAAHPPEDHLAWTSKPSTTTPPTP